MACALCLRERRVLDSHIIPKFVYRWLRESSPTGYLRTSQIPNRREQDGPTAQLLCDECEALFSGWEKTFAEKVFFPLHQGTPEPFAYGPWALKFAVSVSWRVLVWPQPGRLEHLDGAQQKMAALAAEKWRRFLLGETENPGGHEQRLLPLDVIESHTTPGMSRFMSRYMTRVVVADVVRGKEIVFTYSKLCRVLIVGFVHIPQPKRWEGGKVAVKQGSIGGAIRYAWPKSLFDYMNDSANAAGAALGRMSDRQYEKLTALMLANPDKVANSEVFRAMNRDLEFSGKSAFDLRALNQDSED